MASRDKEADLLNEWRSPISAGWCPVAPIAKALWKQEPVIF